MGTKVFGEPNGDRIPGQLEVGMGCGGGPRWTFFTNHRILGAEGFLGGIYIGLCDGVQDLQRKVWLWADVVLRRAG